MKQGKQRKQFNMLKIIIIIDCDFCGESFSHIAISTDRNPQTWGHLPLLLAAEAEMRGWNCHSADYCSDCIPALVCHQASAENGTEIDF
jgi:hypothetical protein